MKNILVVEDEPLIAMVICQMIKRAGHNVLDTVDSAEEAIKKGIELQPDVILMDIRLKGIMDGIEAVENLQDKISANFFFVTGNTDPSTMSRALATNCKGVLSKPFNYHQFVMALEKIA